jgi:UDP-glucuronate 4-epimerase
MRTLVTGAAGFIGSHLAEKLVASGHFVRGVDAFTPYYDAALKRANLAGLVRSSDFELVEADLRTVDCGDLLGDIDVVFHLAAEPGVRRTEADVLVRYREHNVLATLRLLESARSSRITRLVFASSSSVYGNATRRPTPETEVPRPISPYGESKLAAEHLVLQFQQQWGVPAVALRYFTVYGPRQRPDMCVHRFVHALAKARPVTVLGNGEQLRELTFVDDVVSATIAAATRDVPPGSVLNVAGGSVTSVKGLLDLVTAILEVPARVESQPGHPGDVQATNGDVSMAKELLGWEPVVALEDGLSRQIAWHLRALGQP